MLRRLSQLAPCILAASLLSGCSVTIQGGDDPAHPPTQPPPPPPPRQGQAPQATPPKPHHAKATGRKWRKVPPTATKITSSTPFGSANTGAFQGLAYVIPDNTKQVPSVGGLAPFAVMYTDSFQVSSQDFTTGFPGALVQTEWFLISYEGEINVPQDGTWQFRVTSDDGANLYIDNRKVVDNDGVHTSKTADGQATLTAGHHWLRVDYFQARGPVALIVLMGQNNNLSPVVGIRPRG